MSKKTRSMVLLHLLGASALATIGLFLSSCSDGGPTSPTEEGNGKPELASGALHNTAAIELLTTATLRENGSVALTLRARCPKGFQVVEGPVSIIQGPLFREIFGEGFFTTGCNGFWQERRVRVVAPEGFRRGRARASASLDVENPETGEFLQASVNGVITIR